MSEAKESDEQYIKGRFDCEQGIPQRSISPAYMQGYGEQYALEQSQAWQLEQMMEDKHGY